MKTYNWGIIGAGHIAEKFAEGLRVLPQAKRYAVASRNKEKAEQFCKKNGFTKAYGSYQEILTDSEVEIIYVATPNNYHFEHTMMALEAGKAVLCEKPFASNAEQVNKMIQKAHEKNVFLMEALWSCFLPTIQTVKKQITNGTIGNVHVLQADFGFKAEYNPQSRLFDPNLGGGSIPDIGIYPLFLSLYLLGKPTQIKVISTPAPTGTDLTTAVLLKHSKGEISILSSSFAINMETDAKIIGEKGTLKLERMFHMPTKLMLQSGDKFQEVPLEIVGNGYNYEAQEVMNCLNAGRTESSILPHSFSVELMNLLDTVCEQAKK